MQIFVCQPIIDGKYEVAKWNETEEQYVPLPNEVYSLETEAQQRAQQLNKEIEDDDQKTKEPMKKEMKNEKELIDPNELLPKQDSDGEIISPSQKNEDDELIPLEKRKLDDPIKGNKEIERIKELINYEPGQQDD